MRLGPLLRALPDMIRVGFAGVVAYRAEMVIWILSTLLPLIMLALWTAVAAGGPVEGFGETDFARYFTVTLLVRQLASVWLVWELNYEIRNGKLSIRLLKPVHPLIQHGIDMLVAMPFRALVMVPIFAILLWWRPEIWQTPSWSAIALFSVSMAAAWLINFLIQALFATLSFWIDKSDALFSVWFALWSLCSGYLAPLAMFPDWARTVLRALPFRGTLGLPVEILGGFESPAAALPEVGIQLAWVAALIGAVALLWNRGIQRYGAYGA